MGETGNRLPSLEALSGKVYQAKELISRLRQSNRELLEQVENLQGQLEQKEHSQPDPQTLPPMKAGESMEPAALAELERLRRERREVRERISRLVQQLEELEP